MSIATAALNMNKPRRKQLTYGKAARKHPIDSDQASNASHGQIQFADLVLDSGRTTRLGWGRWETSADENTTHGEEDVLITRTELRHHPTSLRNKIISPSLTPAPTKIAVARKSGTAYPSGVRQLTPHDGLDDLAIFEFPSDGSEDSRDMQPQTTTSRKRKRVTLEAHGASASVSDANNSQLPDPLKGNLNRGQVRQARQYGTSASEKPSSGKHTKRATRSRTSCDRVHDINHSSIHRHAASVAFAPCRKVQPEQRSFSGEDTPIPEAQVRSDIPKSGKRNIVTPEPWGFKSIFDDSDSAIQDCLTPKPSEKPDPLQRMQSNSPRPLIVVDNANVPTHTGTARRTAPPITASQGHLPSRRSDTDKHEMPHSEQDRFDAEVPVGFKARGRPGEMSSKGDIQEVTPVRGGSTKLVQAMKQHHMSRVPVSSKLQWNMKNKGQGTDMLDAKSSSQAAVTTCEALASSSTPATDREHSEETVLIQSQAAALSPDAGPKITYARQRSYLTEDAFEGHEDFSMPIEFDSDCRQRQRRRGERSVLPVISPLLGSQEEENAVGGSSGGGIRSIHELREAGEKQKFVHGIESLLDDLENKESWSLSHKRSTLLTLATKLAVPQCALRFTECGLEQRLFDLGHSERDSIARFLLASAIMFLFCNRSSKSPISRPQYAGAKDFLIVLLNEEEDVTTTVRDRRSNISRVSRSELLAFRTLVEQSPVWKYKPPVKVSSQVVALTVLETMIRKIREAGDGSEFLSRDALEQLAGISELQKRSKSGRSENMECDDVTGRLALSILDACTMAGRSTTDEIMWSPEFLDKVVDLLPPTSDSFGGGAAEFRNQVLRLYLNLTNNDPSLCETFSKSKVIIAIFNIIDSHFHALSQGPAGEIATLLLDNLILSLGSLINLVECSDAARMAVLNAKSGSASILHRLLQVFLDRVELAPTVSGYLPPALELPLTEPGGFG